MNIRRACEADHERIWEMFQQAILGGNTYVFDETTTREEAIAYWTGQGVECFVAEESGNVTGAHTLRPNRPGRGSHIANASFMVCPKARGKGVGEALGRHALEEARRQGFKGIQFNFVVSTNTAAVKLWEKLKFDIIGTVPGGFRHASLGLVDVYIMYRELE